MVTLADQLVANCPADLVVKDIDDARVIVLNRPDARNALTNSMKQALVATIHEADQANEVRSIIITGAGGCFSAGADLKELRSGAPALRPHAAEALRSVMKPVIAAVDGACVTGALEVALSCSFILASQRARFADTHAKVGLISGWGMSALLPRAIGRRRANQMMSTGEFIDAARAYAWGLVNEVIDGDVTARAIEIAGLIGKHPASSVNAQIAAMAEGDGLTLEEALAIEERVKTAWREGKAGSRGHTQVLTA